MLLNIRFSNLRSIYDSQSLSLVASLLRDEKSGLLHDETMPKDRMLPTAILYGANASGKTNIVQAFRYLKSAVLFSHSRANPEGGVPRDVFALADDSNSLPTEFELDFIVGGTRYNYGFEATNEAFVNEWLYSFPKGTRRTLFERTGQSVSAGRYLTGQISTIAKLMRPNSLFISTATQAGHDELSTVSSFFKNLSVLDLSGSGYAPHAKVLEDKSRAKRIIKFLEGAGAGIVDYKLEEVHASEEHYRLMEEINDLIEKHTGQRPEFSEKSATTEYIVKFMHRGKNDKNFYLDAYEESEGTRRLIYLLGPIFAALEKGTVIVIDELDASLHTLACEAIVQLFSSKESNPLGAQLVATTHDTNLLRCNLLRRDQVWFVEKDRIGASKLYPLTDIRVRKGDNLERGYVEGRFGATPFLSRKRQPAS